MFFLYLSWLNGARELVPLRSKEKKYALSEALVVIPREVVVAKLLIIEEEADLSDVPLLHDAFTMGDDLLEEIKELIGEGFIGPQLSDGREGKSKVKNAT